MTAVLAVGCSSDDEDDSTKQTYSVTVASGIEHGTVTANPTSAEAGATITLTATPASGYELDSYSVTDSDSKSIAVSGNSFTMPESNVTVNATFKTQGTESGGGSGGTDAIHISHLNEISGSGNYIMAHDIQDERFGSLTNATVSLNLNGHTINSLNDLSINGGTVSLRGNGKIYCKGQMLSYGDGLSEERKHNGFGINNAAVLNIYDNAVPVARLTCMGALSQNATMVFLCTAMILLLQSICMEALLQVAEKAFLHMVRLRLALTLTEELLQEIQKTLTNSSNRPKSWLP